MAPQGPNDQQNQPWWLKAAQVGTAGASGASGNTSNPYGQLAQAGSQFGHALQDKIRQNHANQAGQQNTTSAIDSAVNSTPPMQAGPAPYVPPPPTNDSQSDDFSGVGEPMADGKIVTKPTLAVIGEDRPEAVVPLGFRARAKTRPSMAMGQQQRKFYGEV